MWTTYTDEKPKFINTFSEQTGAAKKSASYLISCISSFRSTVRVLQPKILLPSTINISSLKGDEQNK
jgi:hypothetical protein